MLSSNMRALEQSWGLLAILTQEKGFKVTGVGSTVGFRSPGTWT